MQQSRGSTVTVARTGREVLTRALTGIRTGQVQWGTGAFHHRDGTSCLVGIVAWATDPTHHDRDPFCMPPPQRRVARDALNAVAAVLDERGELDPGRVTLPDERLQPLELLAIGVWNDDLSNELPVIEVLEAALERVP